MFYEEPAKKLPVSASVDVLVLGAGPAGVAAAISAGRQGAKTMLIEQLGDGRRHCHLRPDEPLDGQHKGRHL